MFRQFSPCPGKPLSPVGHIGQRARDEAARKQLFDQYDCIIYDADNDMDEVITEFHKGLVDMATEVVDRLLWPE